MHHRVLAVLGVPPNGAKMFIKNVYGKENIGSLAKRIGCEAGEIVIGSGYGIPGLTGQTFRIKDQLKAYGAKWNGAFKAWTFSSWENLESAIKNIEAQS